MTNPNQKITKSLKSVVEDVNDTAGIVTIKITKFDHFDSDNDRLFTGALTKTWNEGSQFHLVDHKMGISTFVGIPVKKDASTGIIESQLNLKKQVAIDLLEDYKFCKSHGRSLQHSHGFIPIKGKYELNEKGGYDFKEVIQKEYSTVLFGAVSETELLDIKSEKDINSLILDLEFKMKQLNYTDEYCKLLEVKIQDLKEMIKEPSQDTHKEKTEADKSLQKFIFNN